MVAPIAHATETVIRRAAVEWVLAVDATTGRCFAKLDKSVATAGNAVVNCASDTVTLDCSSGANGVRAFDLAVLASQTNRLLNVRVTDDFKVGDSCLASRVYVTRYRVRCSRDYDDYDDYDDGCDNDDDDDD